MGEVDAGSDNLRGAQANTWRRRHGWLRSSPTTLRAAAVACRKRRAEAGGLSYRSCHPHLQENGSWESTSIHGTKSYTFDLQFCTSDSLKLLSGPPPVHRPAAALASPPRRHFALAAAVPPRRPLHRQLLVVQGDLSGSQWRRSANIATAGTYNAAGEKTRSHLDGLCSCGPCGRGTHRGVGGRGPGGRGSCAGATSAS